MHVTPSSCVVCCPSALLPMKLAVTCILVLADFEQDGRPRKPGERLGGGHDKSEGAARRGAA